MSDSVYTRYNTDDIFNRSVIGGLLHLLNHKITYEQIWDDNVVETVEVPFVYNFVSSEPNERFVQDNYTFFGRECFTDKIIDGNFEMLPRFAVNYDGSQIDSSNITNRFIKGEYQVNENGKINSYMRFMYTIPITMNFSIEGWVDNYISAFKIEQKIRDVFYKTKTFNVLYKGMKIGCCVGFPEQITTGEKTVSYTPAQDNQIKMSFSLAIETYQPCFDQCFESSDDAVTTKIATSSKIEHIAYDVNVYSKGVRPLDRNVVVKFEDFDKNRQYIAGEEIDIKWSAKSVTSDPFTVMLYYITSNNEKHIIAIPNGTRGSYTWTIPNSISSFKQPELSILETDDINAIEPPVIRIYPDEKGYITTGSFRIIKPGKYTNDGYLHVSCDYMDDLGNVYVHDCYIAKVSKKNGLESISYYKDVSETYAKSIINTKKLKYKKGDYKSSITLGIAYPLNTDICDEIHNVLII